MTNLLKTRIRAFSQEIEKPLSHQQTVVFMGKGEVAKISEEPNGDGSVNITYEIKPLLVDVRVSDNQEQPQSIAVDKELKQKSRSQALRQKAFRIAQEIGKSEEGLYNQAMDEADRWLESQLTRPFTPYDELR